MSQLKDKYDLTQPSLSGKSGLETFRRKNDGRYFFHVNDKKGAAFLFSQGYDSAETRDKGWQSVLKNAAEKKRYEIKTEQNQFYFVLKAGNNQEIARSLFFDSKLALDKAMEFLMSLPSEAVPVASTALQPSPLATETAELARLKNLWEEERKAKERLDTEVKKLAGQLAELKKGQSKSQTAASSKTLPTAPPSCKDAFRLEFYHEKDEPVRGRIEHLLSGKKQTFQGWDWNGILQFIGRHVGETVNLAPVPQPAPASNATKSAEALALAELVDEPTAVPAQSADQQSPVESAKAASKKEQEVQVGETITQAEPAGILLPQAGESKLRLQFTETGEAVFVAADGRTFPMTELGKQSQAAQPTMIRPAEAEQTVDAAEPASKIAEPLEEMNVEVQTAQDASPVLNFRAGQPLYFRFSAAGKELGFDATGKDIDLEVYLKPLSDSFPAAWERKTPAPLRRTTDGRPFLSGIANLGAYRLLTIARKHGANECFQGHALVNVY